MAGFSRDQLEVTLEENQLVIRGRQSDDKTRDFIHRGIAKRAFERFPTWMTNAFFGAGWAR